MHFGRLNLANAWIRYWTYNAEIFNRLQVWLWSKKYEKPHKVHFRRLAGAEAIAARTQPPGKSGNIVCLPEKLLNPVCLRRIFTTCILGALVICD